MKAIIILLFCLLSAGLNAQNADFDFSIYYQTTSTDTAQFDSLCNRVCEIKLSDTTGIAGIEVKVGTADTLSDILDYQFVYDVNTGLPAGLAYSRNDNYVVLHLLQTYKVDNYFYEIRLKYTNNTYSQSKFYH